jgi:hypothetical protein
MYHCNSLMKPTCTTATFWWNRHVPRSRANKEVENWVIKISFFNSSQEYIMVTIGQKIFLLYFLRSIQYHWTFWQENLPFW